VTGRDRDLDLLGDAVRHAISPIAPPASLERRVLDAVAAEAAGADDEEDGARRRSSWLDRARLGPALAGGAALAAAVLLAVAILAGRGPEGALEVRAVLRAPAGPAEASVEVRKTGIGRIVELRSDSLPILPKGDYYELWFVGPGDTPRRPNRISAGTFHPDENGRSSVRLVAAVDPALYPVLSVTAEPGDGDPRPTGPEVLRAER
jgi:hypothetical protein